MSTLDKRNKDTADDYFLASRNLGWFIVGAWKPLIPAGMEGTWAPVKESGRIAWYFNGNYPACSSSSYRSSCWQASAT